MSSASARGLGADVGAASALAWGKAIEVPGTAALNKGGGAALNSVWCPSAGNCVAGGFYTDGSGHAQAFFVSEKGGAWGKALEVPGTAALNKGGNAEISSVSCTSAGGCVAGGSYIDGSGHAQALVVSGKGGVWGKAVEVPGTAGLNKGGNAQVTSVSCARAGGCVASGTYTDGSGKGQVFVDSAKPGTAKGSITWGNAIEVPGTAALNKGSPVNLIGAQLSAVSCGSAGNCSVGGSYHDGADNTQAFVESEKGGVWGKAIEVPGTAALNTFGFARINAVSCASAGNCSAGGDYANASGFHAQAFVVSEKGGVWGKAVEVPGTAALNKGDAQVLSVSCASAGNCGAGGSYLTEAGYQAFVVSEKGGVWGKAVEVPGTAALNKGDAHLFSVSCTLAGTCSAGGFYTDGSKHLQAFVVMPVSKPF